VWRKSELSFERSVFTRPVQQSKNVQVRVLITHDLLKRKKPFGDGELVKVAMFSAVELLFERIGKRQKSCRRLKMTICPLTQ
jgi:hypothetical protein